MLSRDQNTFHHNPRLRGPVSSIIIKVSAENALHCCGIYRFADFITFFLNIQWKWNKLVNYIIFVGYLKAGEGGGRSSESLEPSLDSPLERCDIRP